MKNADEYGKVVADAQLKAIRLISSSFHVTPAFRAQAKNLRRSIRQDVKGSHYDEAAGTLIGTVSCECWMGPKQEDASKDVAPPPAPKDVAPLPAPESDRQFSVQAEYVILFELSTQHDTDIAEAFFSRIAPISVWPYFRVHVASMAAEGGVNIPVLPIKKLLHRVKSADNYVEPGDAELP